MRPNPDATAAPSGEYNTLAERFPDGGAGRCRKAIASKEKEMIDYRKRRGALMESVDVDAFTVIHLEGLAADRPSMTYLTGYSGFGVLLLTHEEVFALASMTNIDQARVDAPHLKWQVLDWDYAQSIADVVSAKGIPRLGLAARRISLAMVRDLEGLVDTEIAVFDDPVARLRQIKDEAKIACIHEATRVTEETLKRLLAEVKVGMSERQIALRLEFLMREIGAQSVAFDLIVASGTNSAHPHHRPDDTPLQSGELLLLDIGARVGDYCSDITRVVFVGTSSLQAKEIYELVLRANLSGIEALVPGASGSSVEASARVVIEEGGYGEQYTHGLSHGVGLEVHELPFSSGPNSVDVYEPGMVVTVEPAIYVPGLGGVRIEDTVVVTEDGPEVLSTFSKERLIEVG